MNKIRIIPKHDTHNAWSVSSFIPRKNELIHITDAHKIAIGDGVTPYKSLRKYEIPEELEQVVLAYYTHNDSPAVILDLKED